MKKRATKRKAGRARELEALTAERLRNVLTAPGRAGKEKLRNLVYALFGVNGGGDLAETPDYFVLLFKSGAFDLRYSEEKGQDSKGRDTFEQIVALAERHEPKEYKLARRVVEIYAATGSDGRTCTAGGRLIMEAADAVTGAAGECVTLASPLSKYFVPFFVEAVRGLHPNYPHLKEIKTIIKRVDAGEDIEDIAEEAGVRM